MTDDDEMRKLAAQATREVMASGLHTKEEWAELRAWARDRKAAREAAQASAEGLEIAQATPVPDAHEPSNRL